MCRQARLGGDYRAGLLDLWRLRSGADQMRSSSVDTPGVDEVETDRRRVAVIGSVGSGEMPDPGPHRGTGLVDRGQRSLAKASARCRDAVTDIPREPATATTPDQDVGSAIGFLGARMAVGVDRRHGRMVIKKRREDGSSNDGTYLDLGTPRAPRRLQADCAAGTLVTGQQGQRISG